MLSVRYALSDVDAFYVYKTRWASIGLFTLIITSCFGFGIPFVFLYGNNWGFLLFGLIFTSAGIVMMAQLPRLLKQVNRDRGFLEWCVARNGLSISIGMPQPPTKYGWTDIDSIVITEKFHQIEQREKSYSWRILLVFLKPASVASDSVLIAAKLHRGKTPEGTPYIVSQYPKGEQKQVVEEIQRLAPVTVTVRAARLVEFDLYKRETRIHNSETHHVSSL